jgi:hypothetical protein
MSSKNKINFRFILATFLIFISGYIFSKSLMFESGKGIIFSNENSIYFFVTSILLLFFGIFFRFKK